MHFLKLLYLAGIMIAAPATAQSPGAVAADRAADTPVVIVNGVIIKHSELDQRIALNSLITVLGQPGKNFPRERSEVLKVLIDETIKIEESEANNITIDPPQLKLTYERFGKAYFKDFFAHLDDFLRLAGSSRSTMEKHVQSEMAWYRLLSESVKSGATPTQAELELRSSRYLADIRRDAIIEYLHPEAAPADKPRVASEIKAILEHHQFHDQFGRARMSVEQLAPCTLRIGKVYESRVAGGAQPPEPQAWDFKKSIAITPLTSETLWLRYEGQGPDHGVQLSPSGSVRSRIERLVVLLDALRTTCSVN